MKHLKQLGSLNNDNHKPSGALHMTTEVYRYCLSKNDEDIIKHYTDGKPISENARKTLIILSEVFGGLHHLEQSQLRHFDWFSDYFNEYLIGGSLATFDGQALTLLVIIAHDMAVRLEIQPQSLHDIDDLAYEEFLLAYRKEIVDEIKGEYKGLTDEDIKLNKPYIRLLFHQRTREGDYSKRHPTLEDTMKGFRKGNKRYA